MIGLFSIISMNDLLPRNQRYPVCDHEFRVSIGDSLSLRIVISNTNGNRYGSRSWCQKWYLSKKC